jgi:phosphoenolpyruvate carboxykinase (ATP)
MDTTFDLTAHGLRHPAVYRNLSPALLYEHGVKLGGDEIVSSGALATDSGAKKGRSPKDKRVVRNPRSEKDVWWGDVNVPLNQTSFDQLRACALQFLSGCERLYVVDGFVGWEQANRIKVRIICSRPYHALFMHNMLIRPTRAELAQFGKPDFVVFNAGVAKADQSIEGVGSETCVALNFEDEEFVIIGTQYAGEMKKGAFTIMNYLMPGRGVLSMHCSANEGAGGDVSLFFGLSGTGKTTLSADPRRKLIGDDEHCWSDAGISNMEGGCYAKCIHLSAEKEPEIHAAIRFGAVLENVVYDEDSREVDYDDASLTENTRAAYPIEFIPNAKVPCVGGHPKNIILLTCDAFGVLPPVSRLTPEQAMYHFISGYTAKVAGTEVGVSEPQATFSACFGAAFLVWHPAKYAELLAEKIRRHNSHVWLVNTGWSGGPFGVGKRMDLTYTRAIIDAIHDASLSVAPTETDPVFGLSVPTKCPGVPADVLIPKKTWANKDEFDKTAGKLAALFHENFKKYADSAGNAVQAAGPL